MLRKLIDDNTYLILIQLVFVGNRRPDTRTDRQDPPQYSSQEEQWSRAFFLEQLGEGSVEKKPQVEGKNSPTSGSQEFEWRQAAEVEAVMEPEQDSEQGIHW